MKNYNLDFFIESNLPSPTAEEIQVVTEEFKLQLGVEGEMESG
jgi:hypothetical protein